MKTLQFTKNDEILDVKISWHTTPGVFVAGRHLTPCQPGTAADFCFVAEDNR